MRLRRADWLFLLAAGLVVGLVSLLPSPRDRNPPVPGTAAHRGITSEAQCQSCHARAGTRPLGERHPKRTDCFRCHRSGGDERGGGVGTGKE